MRGMVLVQGGLKELPKSRGIAQADLKEIPVSRVCDVSIGWPKGTTKDQGYGVSIGRPEGEENC